MAVSLLANEVSDLCIGKPAVRALPVSAAAGDLAAALRRSPPGACFAVVGPARSPPERRVAGKVCAADLLCFLCASPAALTDPATALARSVSAVLAKDATGGGGAVRRVDPRASVLEALDAILGGAQVLAVPLRTGGRKKQLAGGAGAGDFCWLTQEDLVRYFLNSISLFSHVAARSISTLGLVRTDFLSARPHDAALAAVPLIRLSIAAETAVAVVTEDGHLVGEISPALLSSCDETAAAAIATLSVADLMAYIDYFGSPPEPLVRAIKAGLRDKGLDAMLELMEDESLSSYSLSSSSDEETGRAAQLRRPHSGSYGLRSTEEPAVCSPGSSLVAVMVQALAHRVSYMWVLDDKDDCRLAGIVVFADVLRVFREQLQ